MAPLFEPDDALTSEGRERIMALLAEQDDGLARCPRCKRPELKWLLPEDGATVIRLEMPDVGRPDDAAQRGRAIPAVILVCERCGHDELAVGVDGR